jgi:hypothetical protein
MGTFMPPVIYHAPVSQRSSPYRSAYKFCFVIQISTLALYILFSCFKAENLLLLALARRLGLLDDVVAA